MIGQTKGIRRVAGAALALAFSLSALAPTVGAATPRAARPPVANPALLHNLTAPQRALLARNGFVVQAPSPAAPRPYQQFYDLYEENYFAGTPSFITTDAMLHTFHLIYDGTLVTLERNVFAADLERLSSGLMATAQTQYGLTTIAAIRDAARLNMGYVAVAARLLNPGTSVPSLVARQVNAELALIAAHQGIAPSPLFGYTIDYSKFVPRGHYTSSPVLRRYFQAMTWYGLLAFHLNGSGGAASTRQALLLVRALTLIPAQGKLWAALFDPITTWVGRSDDLTVRDYAAVMAKVYPANAPLSALADNARLNRFIALANALPNPQINGDLAASSKDAARMSKGLRLFGQRFVPDAAIMQSLIWDKVGTAQQPRLWPMGLDVAATLGSSRAATLLTGPLGQARYAGYVPRLAAARQSYNALSAAAWQQNLYWGWLNALRAVWAPAPAAAPAFMHTDAWADKSVATGLGSWTELRHDTILYVKQPMGLGGGGQVSPSVAYVEPVPALYARLIALTQALKATLIKEGMLDVLPTPVDQFPPQYTNAQFPWPAHERGYRAALDYYVALLTLMQRAATQELHGQQVSARDQQALITISAPLAIISDFFQENGAGHAMTPRDKQVALVADVFTEPTSGRVLEEGVGDVLPLYAEVVVNGKHWLARGGVYSYYEFKQPMSDRLTDEAWRALSPRPAQPSWTASYISR